MTALYVYIKIPESAFQCGFTSDFEQNQPKTMSARQKGTKRKAAADSELKAKRARGETELGDGLKWSDVGELLKGNYPMMMLSSDTLPGSKKVIGFDIDFTVIKTASGRKFATGASDWEFWDECVPKKLQDAHKDGYRIVFFTNQAGIEKLKVMPGEIRKKVEDIISQVGIPILTFVSTGNNHYRKPSTTMWDYFVKKCNGGVKPDLANCMYVGDAAGRAKEWAPGKPKDFSCSDRMFAANIGIKFQTPEEFFLGEKPAPFSWHSFDPNSYLSKNPAASKKQEYHKKNQEFVIMVGMPATGKSTFRKRYFEPHGYVAVNRDTMGTMAKCVKSAKEALDKGKSVVADNTNPTPDARGEFLKLAQSKKIPCRCFYMKTTENIAQHLNYVRQNQTNGLVRRVPDVGFNVFKKNFVPPTKKEGFSEIVEIDFVPMFDSKSDETLFKQWTTGGH